MPKGLSRFLRVALFLTSLGFLTVLEFAMSEKEFTYDRIDMDRPSFRLIRLLGGATTYIHCELF
ncbi:hypothetical protein J3E71DRAFT_284909, partial [Bipolaris maydis]